MRQTQAPMVASRGQATIIKGTQTMGGRGWDYDYVMLYRNGDVVVGSEQGNYAGGTWLTPSTEGYTEKLSRWTYYTMRFDKEFYTLINQELGRILKELRSYHEHIRQ